MPLAPEELADLLGRYWAALVSWIGSVDGEAEDIVQSAFIKLAAQDPPPSNCTAWLFAVTKRLAINKRVSSKKRRTRELLVASTRASDSAADSPPDGLDLQQLLLELEESEREVVVARIWGELTFDEIAALTGHAKATVWRAYQSGLEKLRKAYER